MLEARQAFRQLTQMMVVHQRNRTHDLTRCMLPFFRHQVCPDKITTAQWLEVHRVLGLSVPLGEWEGRGLMVTLDRVRFLLEQLHGDAFGLRQKWTLYQELYGNPHRNALKVEHVSPQAHRYRSTIIRPEVGDERTTASWMQSWLVLLKGSC
jgi:hypothetical protein